MRSQSIFHVVIAAHLLWIAAGQQIRAGGTNNPTTIARAIASLMKRANTCQLYAQEEKNCFGDEAGEYGMSACDPKSAMYNREMCFTRTVGLRACLGNEVIASCGLLSSMQTIEKNADVPLMDELLGLGDENSVQLEDAATIEEAPNNETLVTEFALSDMKFSKYLAQSSNMTVSTFRAELDEMVSDALSGAQIMDGGLFDMDMSQVHHNDPDDRRSLVLILPIVISGIVSAIAGVVSHQINSIIDASRKRESFTKLSVEECTSRMKEYGNYGCVMVYDGVRHRVSGIYQKESLSLDGLFGYTLYVVKETDPFIFELVGDGGFINWAYKGRFLFEGKFVGTDKLFRGVRVYEHPNFGGWSKYLIPAQKGYNYYGLDPMLGIYQGYITNDVISSFQWDTGVCALAYEHDGFKGESIGGCNTGHNAFRINIDDAAVYGWDNKVSSILVWNPDNM